MKTPDQIYGDLFTAVQMSGIFPDSKTFVDCIPKRAPADILKAYEAARQTKDFDLKEFVLANFDLPPVYATGFQADRDRPVADHIDLLWEILLRKADKHVEGSSLIPLPHRYIVPGGRFGEIYYWDSYFTILGLLESGRADIAKDMLANFTHLIDTVGHIPNGNRTYFTSRSQPPFFAMMVLEVARSTQDDTVFVQYGPAVRNEYDFWMESTRATGSFPVSHRRTVHIAQDIVLNRYWDDTPAPRQESHREDVELANRSGREPTELFRDLRAACESGWDFSSRWCKDPDDLATIHTTSILPVDLNCLIWAMEYFLYKVYELLDDPGESQTFKSKCDARAEMIHRYFWDAASGYFYDYDFIMGERTHAMTAAGLFPLFMQLASDEQAGHVAENVRKLIMPGGLVTTLKHTGQQWDAPNGWAPLQWVGYKALKNYGFDTQADEIAQNWTDNVTRVYRNTGRLLEKYNVEDTSLEAGGGEYPVQDGFGWTNGVLRKFLILDL